MSAEIQEEILQENNIETERRLIDARSLVRLTVPILKEIIYHHYDEQGKRRPKFLWKFNKGDLLKFIEDEQIEI